MFSNKIINLGMLALLVGVCSLHAEEPVERIEAISIDAGALANYQRTLPDISGEKIYAGKKTSSVELDSTPQITTNNYRQVFSQIPGLLTSEVANESFSSFSYRGIGDPHETFNLLVMQDGIPVNADPYGYPAVYFSPPIESVSSVEFIRGGAGLLYGPLPGGALNYRSIQPSQDPLSFSSKQVTGSRNLYSTFNVLSGTKGDTSYLGYFHHRHGDGFRTDNSDYAINNGNIKVATKTSADTSFTFAVDVYNSEHGEAGGVARGQVHDAGTEINDGDEIEGSEGEEEAPATSFSKDRFQTTRAHDRLKIERYMPSLRINHKVSQDTSAQLTLWSGFLRRYSRRQSQGTTPSFGGIPDGTTNDIAIQQFASYGIDGRVAHEWLAGDIRNTASVGYLLNGISSPFIQQKGETVGSESGVTQKELNRRTLANSVFAENLIHVTDDFRITPGVRLESIYQKITETQNLSAENGLRADSNSKVVPLFGLGMAYNVTSTSELYGNISQGYRPVTYSDAIPLGAGDTISRDLNPTNVVTYETGIRGNPNQWIHFDTSVFMIDFTDQVGRVGTEIQNVGSSRHYGWDVAGTVGLTSLADSIAGSGDLTEQIGEFSLYSNLSLLHADFNKGPLEDKTPQYAPKYLLRTGLIHNYKDLKVQFLGTFLANHFGDDSNSDERAIPSYKVWDLLAEIPVFCSKTSIVAGVNNIFDEKYFSRVRSTGIEAGNPRNYYAGINVRF